MTSVDVFYAFASPVATLPKDQERRREFRQPMGTVGTISMDDPPGFDPIQVMVMNVSLHGAQFRSNVPFQVNSIHRLQIGPGLLQLGSRISIRYSRQRPDGAHDVGGVFV